MGPGLLVLLAVLPLARPLPQVAPAAPEPTPAPAPSCEGARLKCAYRTGCGRALQNYIVGCSALHHGPGPAMCPETCQHALIALTSTDEGKDLMTCQCGDEPCEETKRRVEVCRPSVLAQNQSGVVPCRVAQWICGADAQCSKALEYYHRNCKAMFRGRKCTHRCINSINILRRQEKAEKLDSCRCDGREDYDCPAIRSNMARLCFHQEPPPDLGPEPDPDSNELLPRGGHSGARSWRLGAGAGAVQLVLLIGVALAATS